MSRATKLKGAISLDRKSEPTTTMRVRVALRNDLKKAAVIEEIPMCDLLDKIIQQYVDSYQVGFRRNFKDLKKTR